MSPVNLPLFLLILQFFVKFCRRRAQSIFDECRNACSGPNGWPSVNLKRKHRTIFARGDIRIPFKTARKETEKEEAEYE
jgi:hypothetical protein